MASKNPRPRAKEKACDRAVKRTLCYSAIFNYPRSCFQLYTFLITKKDFEEKFFLKSLRRLVKKKHIKARGGKYYLPYIRPLSWNLRNKYSQELLKESSLGVNMLKTIPWIKMLSVTGAVAANNAEKDDDVDIFIITQKNRMWLSRFFVYLILKIINKYSQGEKEKRKFCCNLFVDETNIKWDKNKQNIYVAHEILSMHPLINRDEMYFRFVDANSWTLKFFKNYHVEIPTKFSKKDVSQSKFIDAVENFFRKVQLAYMKNKKTTEITKKDFIHFNKFDHSKEILNTYKENLGKI